MRTNAISVQWHVLVFVLCTQVIGSRWRWGRRDEGWCGNGRREKGDSDLTYLSLGKQDYVATDACLPGTNLHLPPSSHPPSVLVTRPIICCRTLGSINWKSKMATWTTNRHSEAGHVMSSCACYWPAFNQLLARTAAEAAAMITYCTLTRHTYDKRTQSNYVSVLTDG